MLEEVPPVVFFFIFFAKQTFKVKCGRCLKDKVGWTHFACWWTNIKVHNMPHGDILSVLCWLSWTLPLRGRWEGMVLQMKRHICSRCYRLNPTLLTLRLGPPCTDGKWPASFWLTFSHSKPRSPDYSATQFIMILWPSANKVSSLKKALGNAAALPCHLLCLIHDALKRSRRASVKASSSICSRLPNWQGLMWQIQGSYHGKLFWASCLSVIQYFWHGLLTFMAGINALHLRKVWPNVRKQSKVY